MTPQTGERDTMKFKCYFCFLRHYCPRLVFVSNEFTKPLSEINEHDKIPSKLQKFYSSDETKIKQWKKRA